jgi:hypothetical protein
MYPDISKGFLVRWTGFGVEIYKHFARNAPEADGFIDLGHPNSALNRTDECRAKFIAGLRPCSLCGPSDLWISLLDVFGSWTTADPDMLELRCNHCGVSVRVGCAGEPPEDLERLRLAWNDLCESSWWPWVWAFPPEWWFWPKERLP